MPVNARIDAVNLSNPAPVGKSQRFISLTPAEGFRSFAAMSNQGKSYPRVTGSCPRRSVLKLLGAALAAAAWPAHVSRAASGNPLWRLAVGLNGFESGARKYGKYYAIWEILDLDARNGFDGVELVDGWPAGTYPKAGETERIRALRRLY